MKRIRGRSRLLTLSLTVSLLAAVGLSGCSSSSDGSAGDSNGEQKHELTLVGFSVVESVYDELTKAFSDTPEGKGTSWKTSYGASGDQSKAVANGAKADFVEFSVEPDMTRLIDSKLVSSDWNAGPTEGILSKSVVVISYRKGNPKGITGWADLIKPGIKIVTADPTRSGSAKWNLLAAYVQALGTDNNKAAAETYLKGFVGNVVTWAESGRAATDAFTSGSGDVLISYENEAILARQSGEDLDYLVPDSTFLIENPAAVTVGARPGAADFLKFAQSADGQKIFASKGFRPIDDSTSPPQVEGANDPANPYPVPKTLTTIADLGGWKAVNSMLFDPGALVPTLQSNAK